MATLNTVVYKKNEAVLRFSRPYVHVIPTKMSGLVYPSVPRTKGVSGKTPSKHRVMFFKPTRRVYGYVSESEYMTHHLDVVIKQRYERKSERNWTYAPSVIVPG